MKNRPVLPRTAGLTSLSTMTDKLTKAGLDPSRIIERATILAKARGAARKRKRDDDDEMEIDGDGEGVEGQDEQWMDVDDEEGTPKKRKSNTGAAVSIVPHGKRVPKTDRTTAGMRDPTVRLEPEITNNI